MLLICVAFVLTARLRGTISEPGALAGLAAASDLRRRNPRTRKRGTADSGPEPYILNHTFLCWARFQRIPASAQLQVILKPDPGNPQEVYLGSLEALGIDMRAHDVRFVEDNWESPVLGAWGLGWEVWLDGMEITQVRPLTW